MKIFPLPNSKPIKGSWFETKLDEFVDLLNENLIRIDENTDSSNMVKLPQRDNNKSCKLEFFYFYDPDLSHIPAYKNAIWIKVDNINQINVWIRVGINELNRKKVTVFSECYFLGITFEYSEAYAMPPLFNNQGIWFQKKNVRNIAYTEVLNDIINLLPNLCNDNCI